MPYIGDLVTHGVFYTTGHIAYVNHRDRSAVVHGIMLDTGASHNKIQRDLIHLLALTPYKADSLYTVGSGGHEEIRDQMVDFQLWLGGIRKTVSSYGSDKYEEWHLLIGQPGCAAFNLIDATSKAGSRVHSRITVATERGRERFVFIEDAPDAHKGSYMETLTREMIEEFDRGICVVPSTSLVSATYRRSRTARR